MVRQLTQQGVALRFSAKGAYLCGDYRGNQHAVLARCACGRLFTILPATAFSGRCQQIRCRHCIVKQRGQLKRLDLRGQRFGSLLVLRLAGIDPKRKQTVWEVRCDCGTVKTVLADCLVRKKKPYRSCGCVHRKRGESHRSWKGYGEIPGEFWRAFVRDADKRQIHVRVTIRDLWDLFLRQGRRCALSGASLKFGSKHFEEETTASLDRIDSSSGYVEGNVQWTHKAVNLMKGSLPQSAFIRLCRQVVFPITTSQPSPDCWVRRHSHNFTGYGNLTGWQWYRIKMSSKIGSYEPIRRGHVAFRLSIRSAWHLFVKQEGHCAVTGETLLFDRYDAGWLVRGNASLDRIDSRSGYFLWNVQWVQKDINVMKLHLTDNTFRVWCDLVVRKNHTG